MGSIQIGGNVQSGDSSATGGSSKQGFSFSMPNMPAGLLQNLREKHAHRHQGHHYGREMRANMKPALLVLL